MTQPAEQRVRELEQGFRLGGWEARPHANLLVQCRNGSRKRIHSKAMQVLVQLAAQAGEFVSKNDLLTSVWRDRVVTEDVLTGAVSDLRRTMQDDARNPRMIETRKGAGYRLLVPAKPLTGGGLPRWLRPGWLAGGVGLVGAAVAMIVLVDGGAALIPTVAVLPFANLSAQSQDQYVASAMTDGLIQKLAERGQLRVISRTSVLRYAQPREPLPQIARALGADYLVEGSVLKGADAVRISAQLIDANADTHVWSARYDRPTDDILVIQHDVADRIARRVAGAVGATGTEPARATLAGAELDELLRAKYWLAQEQPAAVERALDTFVSLRTKHAELADAHLGEAQAQLYLFKQHLKPPEVLSAAAAAAERALQLQPGSAAAHRCLAQILFFRDWDFSRAEAHYRSAIELSPSDTVARRRYAWLLVSLQRYPEALTEINEIKRLDPHYYASADGAMLLVFAGQYADAVTELQRVVATTPASPMALRILSLAYWGLKRYDEATAALVASIEARGGPPEDQQALSAAMRTGGRTAVLRYLADSDLFRSAVSRAGLHAQLGDHEAALEWLDRAIRHRDPEVPFLTARPEFAALQDDPRFDALVKRVGLVR